MSKTVLLRALKSLKTSKECPPRLNELRQITEKQINVEVSASFKQVHLMLNSCVLHINSASFVYLLMVDTQHFVRLNASTQSYSYNYNSQYDSDQFNST